MLFDYDCCVPRTDYACDNYGYFDSYDFNSHCVAQEEMRRKSRGLGLLAGTVLGLGLCLAEACGDLSLEDLGLKVHGFWWVGLGFGGSKGVFFARALGVNFRASACRHKLLGFSSVW